jgi:integrase
VNLTVPIIEGFIDRLNDTCSGEGASSYYSRFKKAIRQAYKHRLMKDNIFDFFKKKPQGKAIEKDFLTMPEIQLLVKTPIASNEVRRAAIFSLMTGLAWIDVKGLTWVNIDLDNKRLKKVTRSKTAVEVTVSLNETAIAVIGEPSKPDDKVFCLGSANGANKTLKAWVKRAGINKEIKGWHNLRHSAGTNLAIAGEDVLTISRILAHTSTQHTARYVKTVEDMQRKATDKLNIEL